MFCNIFSFSFNHDLVFFITPKTVFILYFKVDVIVYKTYYLPLNKIKNCSYEEIVIITDRCYGFYEL